MRHVLRVEVVLSIVRTRTDLSPRRGYMLCSDMIDTPDAVHAVRTERTLPDVRAYRLSRVQEQLKKNNCPAILLYHPVNIRYAADTSNMQISTGRNPSRYVMIFADGRVIG